MQTKQPGDAHSFMFLENMEGFDAEAALKKMADLPELYMDTVRLSIRLIPQSIEKMDAFLAEKDLKAFTTTMHGLKSVLRNIGATMVGNNAQSLESAGHENNETYCALYYPPFRDSLNKLTESLKKAFPAQTVTKMKATPTILSEYIIKIKKATTEFNCNKALYVVKACTEFSYGEKIDAQLEEIIFALETFNYDDALKTISVLEEHIHEGNR
jgi:HPt (histidine-containing phosphotransfer) domain-containing protein